MVHHDLSLWRLHHKIAKIPNLHYEELLRISKYHIPTYDEVMDLVAGKKPLNIEIKTQGNFNDDQAIADYVISDLEERGIVNTTLLSSISQDLIFDVNVRYNNLSAYHQYADFWIKQKRHIDTGIIFYVKESTFTRKIPFIKDLSEIFRDSGIFRAMISEMWLSGVNHLMIHGSNTEEYQHLLIDLPFNSRVVFWDFDDSMYLILPDKSIWDWQKKTYGAEVLNVTPWWEDN